MWLNAADGWSILPKGSNLSPWPPSLAGRGESRRDVEQISIALVYKSMDDMDEESVEIGG